MEDKTPASIPTVPATVALGRPHCPAHHHLSINTHSILLQAIYMCYKNILTPILTRAVPLYVHNTIRRSSFRCYSSVYIYYRDLLKDCDECTVYKACVSFS